MEQPIPVPEHPALLRLNRSIERSAPFFLPIIIGLIVLALATAIVFGIMASMHLPLGFTELNLTNTGNVGQFIGGTIGTLFAAISSLLLVITLWVQINEYRLTRQELQQTVKAQQDMARSHAEQLGPLREQAEVSRQVMEMDLLTRAILDLKTDMREFDGEEQLNQRGVGRVMKVVCSSLGPTSHFWNWLNSKEQEKLADAHIGWISRRLQNLYVLLERAELIYDDLEERKLPGTASKLKRKELVLFVNSECRDLAQPLHELKQMLFHIPPGHRRLYDLFREVNTERIEPCIDRLMRFNSINLEQF